MMPNGAAHPQQQQNADDIPHGWEGYVQLYDPENENMYTMLYRHFRTRTPKEHVLSTMGYAELLDVARKAGASMADTSREGLIAACRTDVFDTEGLKVWYQNQQKGNKKRAFLCKNFQRGKCKNGQACISCHANPARVTEFRAKLPAADLLRVRMVPVRTYAARDGGEEMVIDVKYGKLAAAGSSGNGTWAVVLGSNEVPLEGLLTQRGPDGVTLVCVDAGHMVHVRKMWRAPCCSDPACPDAARGGRPRDCDRIVVQVAARKGRGGGTVPASAEQVTMTNGFRELCERQEPGKPVFVSSMQVCQPHLQRVCKWGRDCHKVHVCRKLPLGLEPPAQQAAWRHSAAGAAAPFAPAQVMSQSTHGSAYAAAQTGDAGRAALPRQTAQVAAQPRRAPAGAGALRAEAAAFVPAGAASHPPPPPPPAEFGGAVPGPALRPPAVLLGAEMPPLLLWQNAKLADLVPRRTPGAAAGAAPAPGAYAEMYTRKGKAVEDDEDGPPPLLEEDADLPPPEEEADLAVVACGETCSR